MKDTRTHTLHSDDIASHRFVFPNITFERLKAEQVHWNTTEKVELSPMIQISAESLEINQGLLSYQGPMQTKQLVSVVQQDQQITLFCDCQKQKDKLCYHQAYVCLTILKRDEFKVFFNHKMRQQKLRALAQDYGLDNEKSLDDFFNTEYKNNQLVFRPKQPGLIPVNREVLENMKRSIGGFGHEQTMPIAHDSHSPNLVVLRAHKYYKYLMVDLYHTPLSKDGKPKNPFTLISAMDCIWHYTEPAELKFLMSIAQFQKRIDQNISRSDLIALRTILENALECQLHFHDSEISENVSASSIVAIQLSPSQPEIQLNITRKGEIHEISGEATIAGGARFPLSQLQLKYGCFVQESNTFYLVNNLTTLGIIDLFGKNPDGLLVHASRFGEFKNQFLDQLQNKVQINYDFVAPATPVQLADGGFDIDQEAMLYLSDLGEFVKITPVMRYSEVEINVRTKRSIYGLDAAGKEFLVPRDKSKELKMVALLVKQHPYLQEQLGNDLEYFYLHRKHFLNVNWFLRVFNTWREKGITILGFNQLSDNKLNAHPAKITVKVESGINWFNTQVKINFGKRKASLKKIQLAVRNKSRYVQLDDGTTGILPEEWLQKFTDYFNAGDIVDDENLRTPKINFQAIEQLYDPDMLEKDTRLDLQKYRQKFADFKNIKKVTVPKNFRGTLRPYQQEGLNWLNFLDEFNFGGCLADDMGLGKTIQIIAFLLVQQEKVAKNTNLIVMPTSLIFNWRAEIEKFAPSLRFHVIEGAGRLRNTHGFDEYNAILISYTTLLSDINYLKKFTFNYIFLDESQNIKNPDTQRYRAVMLLKSRNRIVVTGTPIENNTFDLFSQFSFACPGLLGSQRYFRAIYSIPIDKFKSSRRAEELRQKIQPFLLRRTKQQVAADLPEKTEMILYGELKPEQRKIYDAYEKEFRDYISASDNDELKKNSMHVLKGLTKLRQICNSPKLINQEAPGESTSAKIDLLLEQIENHAPGHKMLVFSQFVGMLDLIKLELEARNISFVYLTGASKNRQALVEQFQNDASIRIFLISLKAGGTGLNLTQADYVYLVDPWWNPAVENQAIDRSHRIGQTQNVTAIRLISPDTIEEKMIKMQESKRALTNHLIHADSGFFRFLSKEDLLEMLGGG
jgi:hypothetical protein